MTNHTTQHRVNVTLTFATDTPRRQVALAVHRAVDAVVPDQLETITSHEFDLGEQEDPASTDTIRTGGDRSQS
ncbi:hypothetical protein [Streptomyces sp. DH37]|uniref:hypothetical protein n=1 Tax=Streptomyces sp. DH37 TaxID=3040122 RepID=UPI002442F72B|nr:hypothetical protein [Streptomyces sp. DH37]MDG9703761.1 hypothetical protein [Streptomyces sp. DH37]